MKLTDLAEGELFIVATDTPATLVMLKEDDEDEDTARAIATRYPGGEWKVYSHVSAIVGDADIVKVEPLFEYEDGEDGFPVEFGSLKEEELFLYDNVVYQRTTLVGNNPVAWPIAYRLELGGWQFRIKPAVRVSEKRKVTVVVVQFGIVTQL